jgi:hypothetical protein
MTVLKLHYKLTIFGIIVIGLIGFGLYVTWSRNVKAESPAVDPEKTFLQTFAQNGIKQYQLTEFQKYAVWVDGSDVYNVAGESNGNWTIISRIQLPQATPTPNK